LGSTFYVGLKDAVKDEMKEPPERYQDLVAQAIKIDSRQWERRLEKGSKGRTWTPYTGGTKRSFYQTPDLGDPMDLGTM
jgi:hypothetical protein